MKRKYIGQQLLKLSFLCFVFMSNLQVNAQTLKEQAQDKISILEGLVSQAESNGITTLKERMTIRTAEVFLVYADFDEQNVALNETLYAKYWVFKDDAAQMAADLPDFERNDIIKMLDTAIVEITQLINGEIFRTPSPNPDWADITHDGDQLTYNGRPIFLADYTWKPEEPTLTEFYGQMGDFYIAPNYVTDEAGNINPWQLSNLLSKPDGKAGFIFLGHTTPPQWAIDKYGSELGEFKGEPFISYDIDNPGTQEMISKLFEGTVPHMAGKKYATLGYMLANEPRWLTYKNGTEKVWYSVGVSDFTKEKFKIWLENKHENIAALNSLWGTSFASFADVTIDIPIDLSLQGTPKWYDWTTFNDDRGTDWFKSMKTELRKFDPNAKVHFKIMPSFFTDNDPCTGIDLEAITELSDINGNDCAAHVNYTHNGTADWEEKYVFGWREMYLGYDFLKSIQPNQINFNSESHLLSTSNARDPYTKPEYARATYWAAHILGMTVSQTWYWPRELDGSFNRELTNAYPGSNNQQPRVTQELHNTLIDLNSFSEEIMAMQRQRKPLRIFYSKTSAANKHSYMDDVFELYESLNFEGLSLGFATKNIITKQDNSQWDAILVYKTDKITESELEAIQGYLNAGGTVITDAASLKKNEYGFSNSGLTAGNGTLTVVNSVEEIKAKALEIATSEDQLPEVTVSETDTNGFKTCTWRCVKNEAGNNVLSIINLGKKDVTLDIKLKGAQVGTKCKDLIKGITVSSKPILKPYEVFFVEITDDKGIDSGIFNPSAKKQSDMGTLFPNPSNGKFNVLLNKNFATIDLSVFNIGGELISSNSYSGVSQISHDISNQPKGSYVVKLTSGNDFQSFIFLKN